MKEKEDLVIYKTTQELAIGLAPWLAPQLADAFLKYWQQLEAGNGQLRSPHSLEQEKPLSTKETCELLGVTEPTLRDWRKKGLVRYRKIGDRYYFLRSEPLGNMEQAGGLNKGRRAHG